MQYKISNSNLPVLHVTLDKGETVYSESGGMAWMDDSITMDSKMGGIGKAIGRLFTGESLFKVYYTAQKKADITFCSEFPGQIVPLTLANNKSIICQKDAFMMAEKSVELKVHFSRKLRAGFFGGEGFILQECTGPGMVFLEFDGEVTKRTLKAGEKIKIDPGYIGAFEPTVTHSIEMVKGIKNIFFGGEGLFLATLTGPGTVYLQSMPIRNLARKVAQYVPRPSNKSENGGININLG